MKRRKCDGFNELVNKHDHVLLALDRIHQEKSITEDQRYMAMWADYKGFYRPPFWNKYNLRKIKFREADILFWACWTLAQHGLPRKIIKQHILPFVRAPPYGPFKETPKSEIYLSSF